MKHLFVGMILVLTVAYLAMCVGMFRELATVKPNVLKILNNK